ncbi:MAG: hypothetical protein MK193_09705 [Lentisphaeria bacterium]|nr:hypothetical protein [Lentisphaeria bacterium]
MKKLLTSTLITASVFLIAGLQIKNNKPKSFLPNSNNHDQNSNSELGIKQQHIINGIYKGQIHLKGETVHIFTKFNLTDQGRLIGTYAMKSKSIEFELGELDNFTWVNPHKLSCIWTDYSGLGDLTIHFTQDYDRFTGQKGSVGNTSDSKWNGIQRALIYKEK